MADCMNFPNDWAVFIEDYSFRDHKEFYTNGARLIPTFRVEQMMHHYLRKVATDTNAGEWIPVTERLPDDRTKVLCHYHGIVGQTIKIVSFANCLESVHEYDFEGRKYSGFYNYDGEYGFYEINDVTHWMPLPEPPKGE